MTVKRTRKEEPEYKGSVADYGKDRSVLLETIQINKTFGEDENSVRALADVSLRIFDGEFLVILGSSGSGKSTLLNMLGGMSLPDDGQILFRGQDISHYSDRELTAYRKDAIGFVFQSFNLINELTAKENVSLTAEMSEDEITALFDMLGLSGKLNSYPRHMSGGEQQRVSIARALAKNPGILLCDEPTGALDYESGKQILIQLEKLVREQRRTIILVTHTQEIARMADRVIRMRSGRIVEEYVNTHIESAQKIEW